MTFLQHKLRVCCNLSAILALAVLPWRTLAGECRQGKASATRHCKPPLRQLRRRELILPSMIVASSWSAMHLHSQTVNRQINYIYECNLRSRLVILTPHAAALRQAKITTHTAKDASTPQVPSRRSWETFKVSLNSLCRNIIINLLEAGKIWVIAITALALRSNFYHVR